ncbi:MAG: hypothetical protein WCX13_05385, partial [Candidatus Hydrogenedentales bacterium]
GLFYALGRAWRGKAAPDDGRGYPFMPGAGTAFLLDNTLPRFAICALVFMVMLMVTENLVFIASIRYHCIQEKGLSVGRKTLSILIKRIPIPFYSIIA